MTTHLYKCLQEWHTFEILHAEVNGRAVLLDNLLPFLPDLLSELRLILWFLRKLPKEPSESICSSLMPCNGEGSHLRNHLVLG